MVLCSCVNVCQQFACFETVHEVYNVCPCRFRANQRNFMQFVIDSDVTKNNTCIDKSARPVIQDKMGKYSACMFFLF